ncbi:MULTISPECIES: RidA family protein [Inquilinus]|uniref:Enamine deaminase RidA (YjgF/YER057c/UK114 family) n=1 Tax=Inquilinus ginsengisoli TaxID=363840 RepID=A0ABU1JLY4_9PROT|nr:RidA family protein [Inquilinus ginsengisoli]MDR6289343.1 enamine deaminase RidA (YjgF/YER057c/UK114 family) [Inquilinus ginsengisoli]
MAGSIEARLKEKGVTLPNVAAPAANYVPYVISGNTLYISGQVPFVEGKISHTGKLGAEFGIDEGYACARICGINILAAAKAALGGDLDRIARVVKLGGFVNSTPDFTDQPKVINGASDLMAEAFGDAGKHARAAVGVAQLPLGCAVEVDAIFEIR